MSSEYATITVARKEMTSELIKQILETEFSDTSVEYIDQHLEHRNEKRVEAGEPPIPMPDTLFEKYDLYQVWRTDGLFQFSGETYADDHMGEAACRILRDAGITYEFYLSNDENNADETIWSPTDCRTYDVCKDGHPIVPLAMIEGIMNAGSDQEKVKMMENVFRQCSSYGLRTPKKIAEESVKEISEIDKILKMLDAGAITQQDAFEQIKLLKGA